MAQIHGGTKLANALAEISHNLEKVGTLKVGFLSGAKYPNGVPVALIAAVQNYGAPRAGIPPRPFFSNMVASKSSEWPAAIAGLLKANNYDTAKVMALTGEAIKGQLQKSIIDTNSPPLSPVTLMLRKMRGENPDLVVTGRTVGEAARRVAAGESSGGVSTKPLVWSSQLLNSVAYEVK